MFVVTHWFTIMCHHIFYTVDLFFNVCMFLVTYRNVLYDFDRKLIAHLF